MTQRLLLSVALLLLASAVAAQTGDGEVRRAVLTTPPPSGRFERVDPTRTRLVFSPTGRTLGRGRTRVGTLFYVVPNATVGLSDRVDLGGTLISTFGFAGGGEEVVFPVLGLKVGLADTGTFAAAVGANAGVYAEFGSGDDAPIYVLTPYGAVTLGDEVRSVSASATALVGGTFGEGGVGVAPVVLLAAGGEIQVSNRVKLLADVSLPLGEGTSDAPDLTDVAPVSAGVRLFGDHYAVDVLGAVVDGFPLPLVSISYTF